MGNSCCTLSWYIQGVWVTLDKVKTITVKASVFFDSSTESLQSLTKPSIIKLAGNHRLPLLHTHLHLLSHLPSLLLPVSSHQPPLCDAQRGILQLLSAYYSHTHTHIRTKTHTHTHTCMYRFTLTLTLTHKDTYAHKSQKRARTQLTYAYHKRTLSHTCCPDDSFRQLIKLDHGVKTTWRHSRRKKLYDPHCET